MIAEVLQERTNADLLHLLDMACIGLLLDDSQLLDEQCDWLTHVLAARGVPAMALKHGLDALSRTQPPAVVAGPVGLVLSEQAERLERLPTPLGGHVA